MTAGTLAPKSTVFEGLLSRWRGLPEWLTLVAYAALLAYAIPLHEPWADEAQSWQLARSVPVPRLFSHYLREEGSPGLWHLLLAVLAKLQVSYAGLHWFTGLVALLGVALLIFFAPFPRSIRLMLPFTFFLAFQYAVVARSYVLTPILLFGVAIVWRRSPILVALLLGLLGNVALHVLAISVGFAIVYVIEIWRGDRKQEDARGLLMAASILVILYGFALWTVLPRPSDLSYLLPFQNRGGPLHRIWIWLITSTLSICVGVFKPGVLSVPLWIFFIARFVHAGRGYYLLPIATFALFSGNYFNFWHAGLVIPAAIAMCWIAWRDIRQPQIWSALTVGIACFIALQLAWTIYAVRYHPYSSAPETARFLAPHVAAGESIALTYVKRDEMNAYHSVAIAPYFDRPVFVNQPSPFWLWRTPENTFDQFKETMAEKPRMVLVTFFDFHRFDPAYDLVGPRMELLEKNGYRLTHTFCAEMPQGFGWREENCDLIFEHPL
jgi:hypothetical protein